MSTLTIASLFPHLLNIHGDAENAAVLAVRAGWRGVDASVLSVTEPEDIVGITPDVVTIGAGFDADALEVLAGLKAIRDDLHSWAAVGVPFVAIGVGWDLLSQSVELTSGSPVDAIGIFSGRSVASPRIVGTVAVDTAFGRLVGYEYHLRDYVRGADESPLGTVAAGVGNATVVAHGSKREEGAVRGNAIGTGIRGPVLARNPALADHVLELAHTRRAIAAGAALDTQKAADEYGRAANRIVLADLGLAR